MLKKYGYWLKPILGASAVFGLIVAIWLIYIFNPFVKKPLLFGSSYMTMNNEFYPVVNEQVANYIEQRQDFLYNRDPGLSINHQVDEINFFIAKKVNVILLNPIDSNSHKLNRAIDKAHNAGIKIIIVDSPIKNKNVDCTITSDNYQAGVLCAKELIKNQKSAKILLLDQLNAQSAVQRVNGFLTTIKKAHNPNIKVVARIHTNGQSENSYPSVKQFLNRKIDFNTIMALNDRSAVGALAAVNKSSNKKQIYSYSVDGSQAMKQLIGSNRDHITTVAQSPIQMGDIAIKTAYNLVRGDKVPKKINLPVKVINEKNVNSYGITGWQ